MSPALLLSVLVAAAALAPGAAEAQLMPERLRLMLSGRYAEVERLVEKEIAGDPRPKSAKLLPLCIAYSKLKRYHKVFPCLDRLDENIRAGDTAMNDLEEMQRSSPLLAGLARLGAAFMGGDEMLKSTVVPFARLVRAEVLTELRDYDRAIASAAEALKAIPSRWNEERMFRIYTLAALGVAQALSGRIAEAEKTAAELEGIGTEYPYTGLKQPKWLGVVRIYAALGNFKKAHQVFTDENPTSHGLLMSLAYAVGGVVAGLGAEESFTAWTDLPLAFLKHKTELEVGKLRQAKEGFDRLLARPETRDNGEIYWVLLFDRGRIAEAEGDAAGALEYWRRAIEVIEEQRSTINTEANKIGFVGDKQAVYRALIAALFAQDRHLEAFDYVERSKSRALVDLLAGKKDFAVAAPNEAEIRKLLESAEAAELEARAQVALETRSAVRGPAVRSAGLEALREQAPELASLVAVGSTPVVELQARLPEDEALVEYYYDERALYAFVLTRMALAAVRLEAAGLEAEVRALRRAIETPEGTHYEPSARRLHERLIRPIEPFIGGRKLLVVAHGALHYLPFAALHDGTSFLIERYSLRFLPSASVLRFLRPAARAGRAGVLALGNPDLGDPKLDLHHAQEEALAIAQKMPQSRALLRREASETAVRQYAAGFSYLHFATHGEFNAESPLASALLLARDERSDGLLTVAKLYSMRLDADLVTLSACETALGRIASGDDVVGLTRGFLYAGAATVVASLWKVEDRATAALMTRFYEELAAGDKREALRAAQLATRERYPHPFFWAAFQLTGEALSAPTGMRRAPETPPFPRP
ncbi:MAG TPA: CHAT domain-containing protein [Burkholderiales bacterium]|nr:CHAT domain-containing protein [Burkholderiales bacterium]